MMVGMPTYAGIGSRLTPDADLQRMYDLADLLGRQENDLWIMRTGGAEGADEAFLQGCNDAPGYGEVYLPWATFQGWINTDLSNKITIWRNPRPEAFDLAENYHPRWEWLRQGARKLHA